MQNLSETIKSFEKLFSCYVCFHDYDGLLRKHSSSLTILHINPFCDFVKKQKKKNRLCSEFDGTNIRIQINRERNAFYKICHTGVLELVIPLMKGSHIFALMFVGPFRCGKISKKYISKIYCQNLSSTLSPKTAFLKEQLSIFDSHKFEDFFNIAKILAKYIETEIVSNQNDMTSRDPATRISYFIDCEFRKKLKISDLAKYLGLCESRISQIIRHEFKKSFVDLLTERRIEHAKHLLKESFLKTSTISSECGFKDPAYFFRIFRKNNNGTTPGNYRKKTQAFNIQKYKV